MAKVNIYDPSKVSMQIIHPTFGSHRVTQFGEAMITMEREDPDLYKPSVGGQGDTTLSRNLDRTGRITCSLQPGSPSRPFFDQCKESSLPFAVIIRDSSETALFASSEKTVVAAEPSESRGKEAEDVDWEFWCLDLTKVAA